MSSREITHLVHYDVWLEILFHSSVQSLLNLRRTCKYLHQLMEEHSVWMPALLDILEVIPLPRVRRALPSMSASELRQKSMLIAGLNNLWSRETVYPVKSAHHPVDLDVYRVEVLPGGEFILTLTRDGTLKLHRIWEHTELLVTLPRPDRVYCHQFTDSSDMRRSSSSRGEIWVVVVDFYVTPQGNQSTDFRAYHVDLFTGSMHLLTTVSRRRYCPDFRPAGDFLVINTRQGSDFVVVVRKIPLSADTTEEEAVLNLGPGLQHPRITVLYPHIIFVSTPSTLYLYRIPEFGQARQDDSSITTPLAISAHGMPAYDRSISDVLYPLHDGQLATFTLSQGRESTFILPSLGSSNQIFVRHAFDGPCSIGNSRAIGCNEFIDMKPVELRCFTHYTRRNDHNGYVRLGRTEAPDTSRSVSIQLLAWDGRLEDVSWDEESGRICVIFSPSDDRGSRGLLMVDMV